MPPGAAEAAATSAISLRPIARYRGIRVLSWEGDVLYACRGYQILRLCLGQQRWEWQPIVRFRPEWWRDLTVRNRLTYRLVRDGFHALAVLEDGSMVGAVPGAIVTRFADRNDFRVAHHILQGTRPLHITATQSGRIYW